MTDLLEISGKLRSVASWTSTVSSFTHGKTPLKVSLMWPCHLAALNRPQLVQVNTHAAGVGMLQEMISKLWQKIWTKLGSCQYRLVGVTAAQPPLEFINKKSGKATSGNTFPLRQMIVTSLLINESIRQGWQAHNRRKCNQFSEAHNSPTSWLIQRF